jgi:alkyldihydroxyacetonephosphate synthase
VEIAGRWSVLPALYDSCVAALDSVEGNLVASAHQSHAYTDGACIYLTFAGRMPNGEADGQEASRWAESYYERSWDAVMDAVIQANAAISHHHGIGINRARYMERSLGDAAPVLEKLKDALDPRWILNPGKLGLPSPYGELGWPASNG